MFAAPGTSPWGIPLVRTAAVPVGTCSIADWGVACRLLYREGVNVKASDSDQDDFVTNRVTVLAECRVALAIEQPSLVAVVALA